MSPGRSLPDRFQPFDSGMPTGEPMALLTVITPDGQDVTISTGDLNIFIELCSVDPLEIPAFLRRGLSPRLLAVLGAEPIGEEDADGEVNECKEVF